MMHYLMKNPGKKHPEVRAEDVSDSEEEDWRSWMNVTAQRSAGPTSLVPLPATGEGLLTASDTAFPCWMVPLYLPSPFPQPRCMYVYNRDPCWGVSCVSSVCCWQGSSCGSGFHPNVQNDEKCCKHLYIGALNKSVGVGTRTINASNSLLRIYFTAPSKRGSKRGWMCTLQSSRKPLIALERNQPPPGVSYSWVFVQLHRTGCMTRSQGGPCREDIGWKSEREKDGAFGQDQENWRAPFTSAFLSHRNYMWMCVCAP